MISFELEAFRSLKPSLGRSLNPAPPVFARIGVEGLSRLGPSSEKGWLADFPSLGGRAFTVPDDLGFIGFIGFPVFIGFNYRVCKGTGFRV